MSSLSLVAINTYHLLFIITTFISKKIPRILTGICNERTPFFERWVGRFLMGLKYIGVGAVFVVSIWENNYLEAQWFKLVFNVIIGIIYEKKWLSYKSNVRKKWLSCDFYTSFMETYENHFSHSRNLWEAFCVNTCKGICFHSRRQEPRQSVHRWLRYQRTCVSQLWYDASSKSPNVNRKNF